MFKNGIKNLAVKAAAMLSAAVVCAGIAGSYIRPVEVSADEGLYHSLYDVLRDRSDDPENFMSQELFIKRIFWNCEALWGINYTYGNQEHNLGCDGFVSLVLRLTLGTVYDFRSDWNDYWAKYDYTEEHIVAASYVDQYEIFRPGGTSVTWLYHNYVDEIVEPLDDRKFVESMDNEEWIEYLDDIGAQPGDIMFWDEDKDNKYWTHISIYAGIEDGEAVMWHASSVKGYVCKQSLEEITLGNQFLDYCTIMPMTDRPARAGLTVDAGNDNNDCTYSVYWDLSCDYFIGRISSGCSLEEQEYLDDFALYPNYDHTAYERKLILRKEVTPYTPDGSESQYDGETMFYLFITIEPYDDQKGLLKYSVYGVDSIRYYSGGEIKDYDYRNGEPVITLTDFR